MSNIAAQIFAISALLGLIALMPPLAERLRLPYTVLLAALGCAVGLAIALAGQYGELPLPVDGTLPPTNPWRVPVDILAGLGEIEITANIFLWVFLPLLLFHTALELDTRSLIDDAAPVLLMAVVAVIATTVIAGYAVYWFADIGLAACMLAASIIATTDPVAVIAIFREVGAPRRLVALVEGESLLNDAAAIALTTSLLAVAIGWSAPLPTEIAMDFVWDFFGGAVIGAILGRLAALFIARLDEGGPAEITISLALAYITYAVTEVYGGASGVVAVVAAGLVFGNQARASLASRDLDGMRSIWSQLSFWASSLVFVLASMLVPETLATITLEDVMLLALLILGATVARAIVLFGCLPILSAFKLSATVQNNYKLTMLWGGLRGAVTLALALAVTENVAVPPEIRHLVGVLATGFVLFTLIVQAPTLRPLIHLLRLDQLSPVERELHGRALQVTHGMIVDKLSEAARFYGFEQSSADEIEALYRRNLEGPVPEPDEGEAMIRAQLVTALLTLSRHELELYLDERSRRMISRTSVAMLVQQAGQLIDSLRSEGLDDYRRLARKEVGFSRWIRLAAWLHRAFGINRPLARQISNHLERDLARRHVLRQLEIFTEERISRLFGPRVTQSVQRFLTFRREAVQRAIDALRLQYPDYWKQFGERHLSLAALRMEYSAYQDLEMERMLPPQITRQLLADLRAKYRRVARVPPLDLDLSAAQLIRGLPLFKGLPDKELNELAALLDTQLALPGDVIIRRGEAGEQMYFIGSGAVEVRLPKGTVRLGTGDFFGEMALLRSGTRSADVVAIGFCRLLVLQRSLFHEFLRGRSALRRQLMQVARARETEAAASPDQRFT